MKQIWTVCRTTYLQWLFNARMLLLLLVFVFMYVYCIEPMQYYAAVMQTPLNALEPYVSVMNASFTAPLIPVLFLFLLSDFPKLNQSSTFILLRIGRRSWFWGQILFVALAAMTYLLAIFLFSVLSVAADAFLVNGWSLAVREIYLPKHSELLAQSGFSVISESVLNQIRPYQAVFVCTTLMWGYMIVTGAILMLFAVNGKKMIGIFLNVLANAFGLLFLLLDTPLKWMLPSAHTVFAWHYDEIYNKVYMDISMSYLYDGILLVTMLWFARQSVRRCSFHTIDTTE